MELQIYESTCNDIANAKAHIIMKPIGTQKAKSLENALDKLIEEIQKFKKQDLKTLHPDEIAEFITDFNMVADEIGRSQGHASNQEMVFKYAEFLVS